MKKLTLLFALAIASASLDIGNTVFGSKEKKPNVRGAIEHYNLDDTRIGLRGYSPVSYFENGKAEMGKKAFKAEWRGINYYFTGEAQRQKFLEAPEKFEPAFGGWCAFGMTVEGRFRADPEKWKIINGRLYVFLNDIEVDAKSLWEEDGDDKKLTRKATAFWEHISGESSMS